MIKYAKVRDVISPKRAHTRDAGVDFFIPNDWNDGKIFHMGFGDSILIPSGIKMDLTTNMMKFDNKSGVSANLGLLIGACVIDEQYQGEIHFNLIKPTHGIIELKAGMKITQGIFYVVRYHNPIQVDLQELYTEKTDRGECGFGSTGV